MFNYFITFPSMSYVHIFQRDALEALLSTTKLKVTILRAGMLQVQVSVWYQDIAVK